MSEMPNGLEKPNDWLPSWEALVDYVVDGTKEGIKNVSDYLENNSVWDIYGDASNAFDEWAKNTWEFIWEAVAAWDIAYWETIDSVQDTIVSTWKALADWVEMGADAAIIAAESGYNTAETFVKETHQERVDQVVGIAEWIRNIADASWEFIEDRVDWVIRDANFIANNSVWDIIKGYGEWYKWTIEDWAEIVADLVGDSETTDWSEFMTAQAADKPELDQTNDALATDQDKINLASQTAAKVNMPEWYNLKILDWVVWIYNNGWDRVRYFTASQDKNIGLLSQEGMQAWVDKRVWNKKSA